MIGLRLYWLLAILIHLTTAQHADNRARQHQRMVKRYVIPPSQQQGARVLAQNHPIDTSQLKKRDTFIHSDLSRPLKRSDDGSYEKVKRGELHPLLYWTQHYSRSLSRGATMMDHGSLAKRDSVALSLKEQAAARLLKRWASLHPQLEKRNRVADLIKDSNLFGEVKGLAKDIIEGVMPNKIGGEGRVAAAKTDQSGSRNPKTSPKSSASAIPDQGGEGYSEVMLQAALSGKVSPPVKPTTDDTSGLFIEANDVGYYATMQIGTPAADYKVLMDSGSADFWVPSQQCNADGTCGGHKTLGSKSSSSFQVLSPQQQFQITYGTGSVAGVLAQDTVQLEDGSLSLPNLTFGVTTSESKEFAASDVPFDALMGLAVSTLSNQKVPTYIEALAKAGQVKKAQMGYHLSSVTETQDSQVTFGGVDNTKYTGSLVEMPNKSKLGFWQAALGGVTVDGKQIQISGRNAILDTGTSLIVAPPADAKAIHDAIEGSQADKQGGYIVPCTTTARVAFTFAGQTFSMRAADLLFVPVDQSNLKGMCQSSISAGTIDNQGSLLLGDAFLKNVYFATDVTTNKIGLAVSR